MNIDTLFADWDRDDSPGCTVAVVRDGEAVYCRGFGMANLEHGVPNGPDTVFEIASTSKQFTAACIAMLDADGALSLDDDIHVHVPELADYGKRVTIRHLVHHTGGVMDYFALATMAGLARDDYTKPEDLLSFLRPVRTLSSDPGQEHLYSNTGYFLLALIVERTSGTSLREFASERIFGPLGMTSTLFRDDTRMVIERRAVGYSRDASGTWLVDESWPDIVGDGAVHSTVEDMIRWDANFYDNKLDPPDLVERMLVRGQTNDGTVIDYAFGLVIGDHRGARTVRHAGGFAGFRAELIRFPDHRFSVVCLANAGNVGPTPLVLEIADVYLDDALEPRVAVSPGDVPIDDTLTVADYDHVLGAYFSAGWDAAARILVENGELLLALLGQRVPLVPAGPDRMRAADAALAIELLFDADTVALRVGGNDQGTWSKVEVPDLSVEDMAELEGNYLSDELETTYGVFVADGALHLRAGRRRPEPLEPIERDKFGAGMLTLAAVRDGQTQSVVGLDVTTLRAAALRFARVVTARSTGL